MYFTITILLKKHFINKLKTKNASKGYWTLFFFIKWWVFFVCLHHQVWYLDFSSLARDAAMRADTFWGVTIDLCGWRGGGEPPTGVVLSEESPESVTSSSIAGRARKPQYTGKLLRVSEALLSRTGILLRAPFDNSGIDDIFF